MAEFKLFWISIVAFIVGILIFINGFISLRDKKRIENTPTSKIGALAVGPVEIYGKALPFQNKIYKSPFTNTDCLYYRYTIEEYRKSGKSSHYVLIDSDNTNTPFYIRDETGQVLVSPEGAKIDKPISHEFTSSFGSDPSPIIKDFIRKRGISFEGFLGANKSMKFSEYLIEPNSDLFVFGTAGDNPISTNASTNHSDNLMIQKGKYMKYFLISDSNEKAVLKELFWKSSLGIIGGAFLVLGTLRNTFILWIILVKMVIGLVVFFTFLGLFIIIGIISYIIILFNSIVQAKNQIGKSWGNIDVLLKQRSDMIPNLVSTVKGYAKYEKEIMDSVTDARSKLLSAKNLSDKALASTLLSNSLIKIFGLVENYPKLRANENFLKLQDAINSIENQIADRREFFNDSVTNYNNNIESFPGLIFAKLFNYTSEELFSVSEEDKKLVAVE